MKNRLKNIIPALALFSLIIVGCREFDTPFLEQEPDVPEMTSPGLWVSSETIHFDAGIDRTGFEFRALGGEWTLTPKESYPFLKDYEPKEGIDGNFIIDMDITPNNGMEEREMIFIAEQPATNTKMEIKLRQFTHESKFSRRSDSLALLKIRDALNPDDWMPNNRWDEKLPITGWKGLKFEEIRGEMRVVEFSLNDWNMWGSIAPEIGDLRELKVWSMGGNRLQSRLPNSIANLRNLHTININFSQNVTIFLPDNMDNMLALKTLKVGALGITYFENLYKVPNLEEFSGSAISGELKEGISKMTKLKKLLLSYSGVVRLPSDIGDCPVLEEINVSGCRFLVDLPSGLGNSQSLKTLNVSSTSIVSLPENVGDMPNLKTINIGNCVSLESIPESFCKLPLTGELNLASLKSLKSLPNAIGTMSGITRLDVSSCEALSSFPTDMGNTITEINASYCTKLTEFPVSIAAMKNLKILNLSSNGFTSLPDEFGNMSALEELNLSSPDNLTSLPAAISNLSALKKLTISLYGTSKLDCRSIDLSKLTKLETISTSGCTFGGDLSWLSAMENLKNVSMSSAGFTGSINWGKLPSKLTALTLSKSEITGTLNGIEQIPQVLRQITLDDNHLSGNIPTSIGTCTWLTKLSLQNNDITGTIISELLKTSISGWGSLYLKGNKMSGEIPSDVLSSSRWSAWKSYVLTQQEGYGFSNGN